MINNCQLVALLALAPFACRAEAAVSPTLQGVVEFDERRLAFDITGRLESVRVAREATVHAGDVIATIDDSLERPQREARVADLDAARAQPAVVRARSR